MTGLTRKSEDFRAIRAAAWGVLTAVVLSVLTGTATAELPRTSEPPQRPVSEPANSQLDTITVEAQKQRARIERQISHFVSSITPPRWNESLARWRAPICPLVAGLPPDKSGYIVTRLSQVVKDAGVRLAPQKCSTNFLVIMTPEPEAFLQKWWDRNPRVFNDDRGVAGIRHFIDTDRPIRAWYNAISHGALGSKLSWDTVREITSVIVVVDIRRIEGLNVGQIADYIAMIGLVPIRENADLGTAPTILHLFAEAGAAKPQGLSRWDQTFLKSLYRTNSADVMQLEDIKLNMYRDLVE